MLFANKVGDLLFYPGDIVKYETVDNDDFGVCATNPIKIGNRHFEKPRECIETKETIKAFIYAENENGYGVSYKGFHCFLPLHRCSYKGFIKDTALLRTFQYFTVVGINNGVVTLSLKEFHNQELVKLQKEEVNDIEPGFQFIGEMKGVKRYGLFVSYKFTECLLHVSHIIEDYDDEMSKERKNEIGKWLEEVFPIGEKLLVSVESIRDGQYSLRWDKRVDHIKYCVRNLVVCRCRENS